MLHNLWLFGYPLALFLGGLGGFWMGKRGEAWAEKELDALWLKLSLLPAELHDALLKELGKH